MDLALLAITLLGTMVTQIVYMRAKRLGRFDSSGKMGILGFNLAMVFVFLALPTITYDIWRSTGFTNADARQAGQSMIDKYLQRGAEKVDAEFIVVSHSRMTGYVTVTEQDGSQTTLTCEATMGGGSRYITACRP